MNSFATVQETKGSFRFHVEFKSIELEERPEDWIIEGYATTPNIDRDNEIIEEKAVVDALNRYMTNPIILYQHDHNEPIGTVLSAVYDHKGLKIRALISKTAHKVWTLIQEGILKAFSISGLVLKTIWDKIKKATRITIFDVVEVSVVSVPANPESLFSAVSKAVKSFKSGINMPENTNQLEKSEDSEVLSILKKIDERITVLEEKVVKPPEPKIEEVEDEKTKSYTEDEIEQLVEKRLKAKQDELPMKKALTSIATQDQVEPEPEKKSSIHIVKQMQLMNEGIDPDSLEPDEELWL